MSDKTGELGFKLELPDRLGKVGLPIEVRTSGRKLIGRYDVDEKVKVEPGSYFVSVRLPSGDELTDWVDVESGGSATAQLAPEAGAEGIDLDTIDSQYVLAPNLPPQLQRPPQEYVTPESFSLLTSRRAVDPSQPIGVRAWSGTIGHFKPLDSSAYTVDTKRGLTRVIVPQPPIIGDQLLFQLVVANRPGTVMVLPIQPGGSDTKAVIAQAGDELVFDAHLQNELADVMIRDSTEVKRTQSVGKAMEARGLLEGKGSDPIAAAAGAVALLGIDEAERVHNWLESLARGYPWLADGPALAAESAARLGDHKRAIDFLLLLEKRGIPLFADSLAFAVDRLGEYARATKTPFTYDRPAVERVLARLSPFAAYRMAGRSLTTFRALDPNDPSDKKCAAFLPDGVRQVSVQLRALQRSL